MDTIRLRIDCLIIDPENLIKFCIESVLEISPPPRE
jgi:hypothetical protein